MRAYSFTNFYLNSISQGIQPAHALVDMFTKYTDESPQKAVLFDWAINHKTMICLNGGNAQGIRDVWQNIIRLGSALQLPFQKFHEDEQSLDGSMTCVAIIVPTYIYEGAAALRSVSPIDGALLITEHNWSDEAVELMGLLNSYGLAK